MSQATSAPPASGPKIVAWHPVRRGMRLFGFFSVALLMTGAASALFADLLWRDDGWSDPKTILLLLFIILFFCIAFGCLHAVVGFFVLRFGDRGRITDITEYRSRPITDTSTAIIIPIYNEDVPRVYNGIRTIFESLQRTGETAKFDFFILSDSTNPEKWVEEESRWFELARELNAVGKIFYRRRQNNEGKKSGNVRDFLNAWGSRYKYMICLDADSIMQGVTIVDLVKLMEANPNVGLIQTAPGLIGSESLFGRLQQFANRFYGPIFVAGLNYWVQEGGNYWGHNAIIRVEPFMKFCDLPQLPGKKPFGGQILSHDFVEAALLRKEDWEVWLAWELDGSWEEGPQGLIESAQRDRRWCQGNLQHGLLLFARGLRGISRFHLTLGILGYLVSPLWLLFLIAGAVVLFTKKNLTGGLSILPPTDAFTPFLNITSRQHSFLVFAISMTVLFLPKVFGVLDIVFDSARRARFGGFFRILFSVILETFASALHAPILMLFHSKFVLTILLGQGVNWGSQRRAADGTAWVDAFHAHWGHTLVGLGWGAFAWYELSRDYFYWFLPVLIGMALSIPVSVLFSRRSWGRAARSMGLLMTPEEISPPEEISRLDELMEHEAGRPDGLDLGDRLTRAIVDPYTNAIHVTLLREKKLNPVYALELETVKTSAGEVEKLREKLLAEGPASLTPAQKIAVMSDTQSMSWLHSQTWLRPAEQLHEWWRKAIRAYWV